MKRSRVYKMPTLQEVENFIAEYLSDKRMTWKMLVELYSEVLKTETTIPMEMPLLKELQLQARDGKIFMYSRDTLNRYPAFSKSPHVGTTAYKIVRFKKVMP